MELQVAVIKKRAKRRAATSLFFCNCGSGRSAAFLGIPGKAVFREKAGCLLLVIRGFCASLKY
jgi:hypothetical protein